MASVDMMDSGVEAGFHGTWKIVKVEVYSTEATNVNGLEGVEFHLSESGDIFWKVPNHVSQVPYIVSAFDFYRVTGTRFHFLRFIGGQSGEWFDFNAMLKWEDRMHLKHENVFTIICEKVWSIDKAKEEPYSLLPALREGFFSDITIKAANGKKFLLHLAILQASCPRLHWLRTPPPLTGVDEDTLKIVLHYFYAECLPMEVSSESIQGCLKLASKTAGLEKLADMCREYIKKAALREQIFSIINELHSCADRVINIFSSTSVTGGSSGDNSRMEETILVSEPAKLCFAVKQAVREAAVAGAKCILICDLFSRKKNDLSRQERHEIIKYAKSRIPIFLKQLQTFLEAFYSKLREIFSVKLSPDQRHDVAAYLVPEVQVCVNLITRLMEDSRQTLKEVLRTTSTKEKQKKNNSRDYLHRTVQAAMHVEEMLKLRSMQTKLSEVLMTLQHRKALYEDLPEEEKVYALMKLMEQLLEEIPLVLSKANKLSEAYGNLPMKKWKFYFKMATSKVAWGLQKASANKTFLQPVVRRCCDLVHRDAFSQTASALGLLEPVGPKPGTSQGASPDDGDRLNTEEALLYSGVESLKTPPIPGESRLARILSDLFYSGEDTDMVFKIIHVKEEPADIIVDHTQGTPVETQGSERVEVVKVLKAHRAIIAARCDWFRRALMSGMRESIDKKIEVHDIDPDLFVQFVHYLYSGQLDTTIMNIDQLADMMAISDRYEMDNLKKICEGSLIYRLDEESVLFLLSVADQFHASTLREASINYITEHPLVVQAEEFEDLAENLQNEVTKIVSRPRPDDNLVPVRRYKGLQYDSDSSDSSDYSREVQDLASGLMDLRTGPRIVTHQFASNSGSSDEEVGGESVRVDTSRLDETVQQLKEVLGDSIPSEELRRLARAADYDVNRAINFFFNVTPS